MAQIHVDDIVYGCTSETNFMEFATLVKNKFEMSVVGKLNFLGLQVNGLTLGFPSHMRSM